MSTQKRQRWVMVALVVTLIFLGWQVSGLVQSDLKVLPTAKKNAADHSPVATASGVVTPTAAKWDKPMLTSASEKQYLQLAAEIQKAKMHRQLLQQQVAIAAAKKKLALSHQQTLKLSSSGADELASWSKPGMLGDELRLVYLAKREDGRWEATLQRGGEYLQVVNGTDLGRNMRVFAITENGLWVEEKGKPKQWLGFAGDLVPVITQSP